MITIGGNPFFRLSVVFMSSALLAAGCSAAAVVNKPLEKLAPLRDTTAISTNGYRAATLLRHEPSSGAVSTIVAVRQAAAAQNLVEDNINFI